MSLIRQIWLLLIATLALAFAASVLVHVGSVRDALQTQLQLKNSDNAGALALVLSQQRGQRAVMELAVATQFDTGFYRRLRFVGIDGVTVFAREASAQPMRAPAWFARWLAIDAPPGVAQVSDGWRALGSIEVESQSAYAHDALWLGTLRAAAALAAVGAVAAGLAFVGVRRLRRPLDATVEQAASLQRGEYVTVAEPRVPELRRLTRAMNAMVARLRTVLEAQAEQVDNLRRQANCDPHTALANRGHFMTRMRELVHREDGAARSGMVLLRLANLAALNAAIGRDHTDAWIVAIARALQGVADHTPGAFAGRLNGSDFALALPEGGAATSTALALVEAVKRALAAAPAQVKVFASAVEVSHGDAIADLMAAADLALAGAEAGAGFTVVAPAQTPPGPWARAGEAGWRQRLRGALANGQVRLGGFPLIDAAHRLIHIECPLRVQLDPQGAFEVAAHWLPLAIRSRMTCEIDERALALALQATALDGQPRCVNLSPDSLADSAFASRLRTMLQAAPEAARLIWLEVNESAAIDRLELVSELVLQLRPSGVRIGLEHAGERLTGIERVLDAGLDYVKLDASVVQGVSSERGRADYVRGLRAMLNGAGLQVYAEGVATASDAHALWGLGLDGQTGPWASAACPDLIR